MPEINDTTTTESTKPVAENIGDFITDEVEPVDDRPGTELETAQAQETEPAEEISAASETTENEDAEGSQEETQDESDEASEETAGRGKKKGGFQRKLDKVTRARRDAERDRDHWREMAMRNGKPEVAGNQETKTVVETKVDTSTRPVEPDPEKFDTHAAYLKAQNEFVDKLTDWKYDQRRAADQKVAKENQAKSEYEGTRQKYFQRATDFTKTHADFKTVIESVGDVKMSPAFESAILDSENGPELMYEFAKNPEELKRICALPPIQAARAIGQFEARLAKATSSGNSNANPVITEKNVTKAPPPINTLQSKATGAAKTVRDELDYDDWAKIRRADLKNA